MTTQSAPSRLISVIIPVYRDGARAARLVERIHLQQLPRGASYEVIVVDDGSDDSTADLLRASTSPTTCIVTLTSNRGRAVARNLGAAEARGEYILFLDCDCLPANPDLISAHLAALAKDSVASIGPVLGVGNGFWNRYQSDASSRRARQHAEGITYSGSSQNLMIRRTAFQKMGGFDVGYRAYGFEDRDLQIRLSEFGSIEWAPEAVVHHLDEINLRSVARKMMEAGMASSGRFSQAHPEAYQALGYAALDVQQHQWLWPVARMAEISVAPLAMIGDAILERRILPYRARRHYARLVSGLSFLAGTSRRHCDGEDKRV